MLAQSGYTDAEINAARDSVLESIRQQRYKVYGDGSSGEPASGDSGDANGLFYAAYAAAQREDGDITTAEEYIAKNYKAFGFSSASGLVEQYRETMSPDGTIVQQEEMGAPTAPTGDKTRPASELKAYLPSDECERG